MREVAAAAEVSLKTVSRVVNGESGVSPELTERVGRVLQRLDYRHHVLASSLRRSDRRTASIGLVVTDVANPFSSVLSRAVEDVARSHGAVVLSASSDDDPQREEGLLRTFAGRQVDGFITVPAAGTEPPGSRRPWHGSAPMVLADRPADGFDTVTSANRAGAQEAVEHLLAGGHRRIAYLGDRRRVWTATQRWAGFAAALSAAQLGAADLVRHDLTSEAAAGAALAALLDSPEPPTAVFSAQNLITLGALRTLAHRGQRAQIALVGFDDLPAADLMEPGLTVVAQDVDGIGRAAAELLFDRLAGAQDEPRSVVVPTRLIARGTGEIRPGAAPTGPSRRGSRRTAPA